MDKFAAVPTWDDIVLQQKQKPKAARRESLSTWNVEQDLQDVAVNVKEKQRKLFRSNPAAEVAKLRADEVAAAKQVGMCVFMLPVCFLTDPIFR